MRNKIRNTMCCVAVGKSVSIAFSTLVPFMSAIAGATIALFGNRVLQRGLARKQAAEEIKQKLYHIITLTSDYWIVGGSRKDREKREARILVEKTIAISQLYKIGRRTRRLRGWYSTTREQRLGLLKAMTGGCFQQKSWSNDLERVLRITHLSMKLISSLEKSC